MSRARDMADMISGNFNVPASSLGNVAAFPTGWSAELSGSDMTFSYNSTAKFKLTTAGAVTTVDDITAFGTV